MRFDLAFVLRATGATACRLEAGTLRQGALSPADLIRPVSEVTIDSRSVAPDSLFVALPGERVDGHDFVPQALTAGALACLVTRLPEAVTLPDPRYLLDVPDTLTALQRLASCRRQESDAEVVGITGSIGKTTTKEILSAILATEFPVLKSDANLNTEIGLPLMLLRLRPEHRVAVLEMGMYVPGDIGLLARVARPRIGVVTNVAPIHLERAGSIERIARGKSELVTELPADGLAVLNGDNVWTRAMASTSGLARSVLFGLSDDCEYRALEVRARGLEGVSFTLEAEGRRLLMRTSVPGTHTVSAYLAAIAVARELGMSWGQISDAVEAVRLDTRQRIIKKDDVVIIDDSYNAAPMSVNAALELLRESPGSKIAVLGDMLELGPEEEAAHRAVGQRAAGIADWLVARGPRSNWIADEAARRGMLPERVRHVPDNASAVAVVGEIVREPSAQGWAILVKGSRGMRMEEVVSSLESREWQKR